MKVEVYSAGKRQLTLPAVQVLARFVNRGQRRRAHRIDRHARSGQVENIGNPVRDRAERRMKLNRLTPPPQLGGIQLETCSGDAGEDADPLTMNRFQRLTGIA